MGCGWDMGFESGDIDPNSGNPFTFTGTVGSVGATPWLRETNLANVASGAYSIRSPLIV